MYNTNGFYNGGYYIGQNIDNLPIQDIRYVNNETSTFIVPPNKKVLVINLDKHIASVKFADFNGNVYSKDYEFKELLQENTQKNNTDFVSKMEFDQLVATINDLKEQLKTDKSKDKKNNSTSIKEE